MRQCEYSNAASVPSKSVSTASKVSAPLSCLSERACLFVELNFLDSQKTVVLATDGEIYTEGKDMLIYSSAGDNCYLLFASEEDTAAAWARSLAISIEVGLFVFVPVFISLYAGAFCVLALTEGPVASPCA